MRITVVGGIYRVVKPKLSAIEINEGDICILVRDEYDGVPIFYSDKWSGNHCMRINRVGLS